MRASWTSAAGNGVGGGQNVPGLVVTVPVIGERPVEIEGYLLVKTNTAAAGIVGRIMAGASGTTVYDEDHGNAPAAKQYARLRPIARRAETPGSTVSYRLAVVPAPTATVTVAASATFRAWIRVKSL